MLALTVMSNTFSANMYIYKNEAGQALMTNVSPNGNVDKSKRTVKVTYSKNNSVSTPNYSYTNDSYAALNSSRYTDNSMQTSSKLELPHEYRLPTKNDVTGDWKQFNAPNHLKADFNGDGIEDEAYILPKENSELGYGVFVWINKAKAGIQTGRKFQVFKLNSRDDMQPQSFAIELAEPSNKVWETACGKGYWECEIGEKAEFKIKNPSIMFCYIESACTMYMWDSSKLFFEEIVFSD